MTRSKLLVPAAICAVLVGGAGFVSAYTEEELTKCAKVSSPEARAIALKAFPGKTDEELEQEKGGSGLRYSLPGPTWQPGMSIEQESSAAVKSKVELLPSIGLWAKSWGKSLTNLLAASLGSWTTALLIEGRRPSTAYVTSGPT